MGKYLDRDAVLGVCIHFLHEYDSRIADGMLAELEHMEAVDAEQVVHCSECRYADPNYNLCKYVDWYNGPLDYCSLGARKEASPNAGTD